MRAPLLATKAVLALLLASCGGAESKPTATPTSEASSSAPANASSKTLEASPSADEACRNTKCRPAQTIELFVDATRSVKIDVPALPYAENDVVGLIHGDEIAITGDRVGNKLVHLRLAKPGESAIKLKFRQERDGAEVAMMLYVNSPYDKPLRYDAAMNMGRRVEHTSACPVFPGIAGIEHWPHPIAALFLRNFELVEAKGDMSCK